MLTLWAAIALAQAPPEGRVHAIVAARDLYQGVEITEEDLYAVEIPPEYLPEGVFLDPRDVLGRVPRERILANEWMRAERLERASTAAVPIPDGHRLVPIDLDVTAPVGAQVALWRNDGRRCRIGAGVVAEGAPAASVVISGAAVAPVLRAQVAKTLSVELPTAGEQVRECSD